MTVLALAPDVVLSNFPVDGWWAAFGSAVALGGMIGAVVALMNSWGPS